MAQRGKGGLKMKKTLAKAIIFAVVVGGICYQSGPVYAGETWYGSDKIEILIKKSRAMMD